MIGCWSFNGYSFWRVKQAFGTEDIRNRLKMFSRDANKQASRRYYRDRQHSIIYIFFSFIQHRLLGHISYLLIALQQLQASSRLEYAIPRKRERATSRFFVPHANRARKGGSAASDRFSPLITHQRGEIQSSDFLRRRSPNPSPWLATVRG